MTNGAPIHIKPEQAISEAAALGEKIARGVALFSKLHDDDVAIATTPKDESRYITPLATSRDEVPKAIRPLETVPSPSR